MGLIIFAVLLVVFVIVMLVGGGAGLWRLLTRRGRSKARR